VRSGHMTGTESTRTRALNFCDGAGRREAIRKRDCTRTVTCSLLSTYIVMSIVPYRTDVADGTTLRARWMLYLDWNACRRFIEVETADDRLTENDLISGHHLGNSGYDSSGLER
jgi:hypothetical protein